MFSRLFRTAAATVLVAALAAVASAQSPRLTIEQVLRTAERAGAGRIVGIDFTRHGRWDVYHAQNGRLVEWQIDDQGGAILRREVPRKPVLQSNLDFRRALAALRKSQPGVVISLELEQDKHQGLIWSGVVRTKDGLLEVDLDANNGTVIEIERKHPGTASERKRQD